MAGMYRRNISPNFSSPGMQVAASQGAGGAIPRGGVAVPTGQQDNGIDPSKLGGLLGMMGKGKDQAAAAGDATGNMIGSPDYQGGAMGPAGIGQQSLGGVSAFGGGVPGMSAPDPAQGGGLFGGGMPGMGGAEMPSSMPTVGGMGGAAGMLPEWMRNFNFGGGFPGTGGAGF